MIQLRENMYDKMKLLLCVAVLIHFSLGDTFKFDKWSAPKIYKKQGGWQCLMSSLFNEKGMNISIDIMCNSPDFFADYTSFFSGYLQRYIGDRTENVKIKTGKEFTGKDVSYLRIVHGPDLWLPNIICELEGLRHLEVVDSKLEALSPTCLRQLQKLSVLKVVNSNLMYFEDTHPFIYNRFNYYISTKGKVMEENLIHVESNEYERNLNLISVFQQLEVLDLSYNNIAQFPFMKGFHPKSNLLSTGTLNIEGNPWVCDCAVNILREMLMEMKTSGRLKGPLCSQPADLQGRELFDLDIDSLKCDEGIIGLAYIHILPNITAAVMFFSVFIAVGGLHLMLTPILTISVKIKGLSYFARIVFYAITGMHPFDVDECLHENKLYDVFLSYAPNDEEYAKEFASMLQACEYRVVLQNQKMVAGEPVLETTVSLMKSCRRTICLLSPSFIACRLNMVVLDHMFKDKHCDTRLILFRLEPSEPMSEPMNTHVEQNEIQPDRWPYNWYSYYTTKRLLYHMPQWKFYVYRICINGNKSKGEISEGTETEGNTNLRRVYSIDATKLHLEDSKPDFDSDSERKYDVFISYCDSRGEDGEISEESRWTQDLAKQLEQDGYKVFIHSRDFLGGVPIFDNIDIAIESSKRVMCVLSTNFCASAFCNWEFQVAYGMQMTGKHRILAVLFEGIDSLEPTRTVKSYLESYSYLDRAEPNFYESLLRSLPKLHD